MKDAFKYVCAGIVGTLIIGLALMAIAMLPIIPAAVAALITAVASIAIMLFPGAVVVYGILYFYKKRKGNL